jgi:hypothetical protein
LGNQQADGLQPTVPHPKISFMAKGLNIGRGKINGSMETGGLNFLNLKDLSIDHSSSSTTTGEILYFLQVPLES